MGQRGFVAFLTGRECEARRTAQEQGPPGARCRGMGIGRPAQLNYCWFIRRCLAPVGQGTLRGCEATLLVPWGQGRFERLRAGFWDFGAGAVGGFLLHASHLDSGTQVGGAAVDLFPSGPFSHPAGLRRALPAPAQGICPLRIPFAAARHPDVTTQAGRPLLVGRPARFALSNRQKRNKAPLPHNPRGRGAITQTRQLWPAALPPLPPD